tara:strand:+ start:707 stop:1516 length:810 start_codon:yes stop_codon:yes gene_type:complete
MEIKENKYFTFFDLLKKIFKYWYISFFSIIIFCSSTFYWEKNKTIYNIATLSILPLSIVEYENLFSTSNFSKITDDIVNINTTSDRDSFYMLNYTALSLLYAYTLRVEEIIFKQNFENEIYKELAKKTTITLSGTTDNQIFLFVYVKSARDKKEITRYLNWLANEANTMTKNKIVSLTKKEIKETQNKIGLLNEIDSKDNIRVMTNYQIKILELEDILAQPNKNYAYFNAQNTNFKSNSFDIYKMMLLSFLVALMLSLIIILFLPDRKN